MNNGSHNSDDELGGADGVTMRRKTRNPHTPGRSRNSSISSVSSTSSTTGRVREMVDEFERATSTTDAAGKGFEEEGTASSRSASPTKMNANATSRRMGSPSKNTSGRVLPHRPSVNDLFRAPSAAVHRALPGEHSAASTPNVSDKDVDEKEHDETITRVAKRNINGREARLLPFPSDHTNGVMPGALPGLQTPLRTGMSYPF